VTEWVERVCRVVTSWRTVGHESTYQLFYAAEPVLDDPRNFIDVVAAALAQRPDLIE